jgi:hypothetical protein
MIARSARSGRAGERAVASQGVRKLRDLDLEGGEADELVDDLLTLASSLGMPVRSRPWGFRRLLALAALADSIGELTAYVRHAATVPLVGQVRDRFAVVTSPDAFELWAKGERAARRRTLVGETPNAPSQVVAPPVTRRGASRPLASVLVPPKVLTPPPSNGAGSSASDPERAAAPLRTSNAPPVSLNTRAGGSHVA